MKTYGTHASVFGPYVLANVVFEIHPHITSQTFSHCWEYELNCMSFTISSSIPPLMDIWIASFPFCLLQIKLQQPLPLYTCVCVGAGGGVGRFYYPQVITEERNCWEIDVALCKYPPYRSQSTSATHSPTSDGWVFLFLNALSSIWCFPPVLVILVGVKWCLSVIVFSMNVPDDCNLQHFLVCSVDVALDMQRTRKSLSHFPGLSLCILRI